MLVSMPQSKDWGSRSQEWHASTGAAWPSSARDVNRNLKWHNERNPCSVFYVSQRTASLYEEEGGEHVPSAWPLCLGPHTCYIAGDNGSRSREAELILKTRPGSDRRLKLASVKLESLVIADQTCRGEYVLGLCTHCPSGQGSSHYLKTRISGKRVGGMTRAKS